MTQPGDDIYIAEAVNGLEHEPGQVAREGLAQLIDTMCSPNCGFCTSNTYDSYYGPQASNPHRNMRMKMVEEMYTQIDEQMKDGYTWPIL